MSGRQNKRKAKKKVKKQNVKLAHSPMLGTVVRPPQPAQGMNIRVVRPARDTTISRQLKLRIPLSTTGSQTFDNISLFLYKPMQYTRIVAGSIVVTNGSTTSLSDLRAIFREYRVKKIYLQYTNSLGTSTAFPPVYVAIDPELTPTDVGNSSYVSNANLYQNGVQVDAHISTTLGYWVPNPTALANQVDNIMAKGWLSTDLLANAATATDVGVIVITYGDATLAAPLTTTAGILDVVYDVQFKVPDN